MYLAKTFKNQVRKSREQVAHTKRGGEEGSHPGSTTIECGRGVAVGLVYVKAAVNFTVLREYKIEM